jgi:hypothetical protein
MKTIVPNMSLVLLVVLFFVLGCGTTNTDKGSVSKPPASGSPSTTSTNKAEDKPAAPEITIDAKALTKAYDENELAADEKYSGKTIAVTGKISNIADTLGNVTVQLDGINFTKNVMCSFAAAEKGSVTALKKGQTVTLVGTGDGMTMGLYVGLKDCRVKTK